MDIGLIQKDTLHTHDNPLTGADYLYVMHLILSSESITHERRVYNIMDLFGDFGGVLEVALIFA